jgi:hypothetical protein
MAKLSNKLLLIFTAAILLCLNNSLSAQGPTLQFSRVILVSTVQTVPAGKVWKIENILPSARLTLVTTGYSGNVGMNSTNHVIAVNGTNIYVATADAIGSTYGNGTTGYAATASNILNNPIWLPEGTTLAAGTGVNSISVIEFTIVP